MQNATDGEDSIIWLGRALLLRAGRVVGAGWMEFKKKREKMARAIAHQHLATTSCLWRGLLRR